MKAKLLSLTKSWVRFNFGKESMVVGYIHAEGTNYTYIMIKLI